MKHIKLFEGFINEAASKYRLLIWKKMVGEWPEYTGCIIDNKYKILEVIDLLFDQKTGEYTKEVEALLKKYNDPKHEHIHIKKDKMERPTETVDPEEAVKRLKEDKDSMKRINKFMTPEKQAEIIAMFNKKD